MLSGFDISSGAALSGWRFLITGASRGLGRGLASGLLANGATVMALARSRADLASLANEHSEARQRLLLQEGSMLEPAVLEQAMEQLALRADGCDVLIANAGVYGPREPFHASSAEAWEEALLANVLGLSRTCRACIPALAASGRGQILVIGSAIGHQQALDSSSYAASKAMGWSLVKCLSLELEHMGIAVNELIPGPVATAMNSAAATLPFCRQPDDLTFIQLISWLCGGSGRPPSGQSFSLRNSP